MTSRYDDLSRAELAVLVPELLLMGQLIDRSGMAWCISAFGREEMLQIAIEEWATASPIYTRRMQQALGYAPEVAGQGDVVTIFKGLQLDIGAPPQFMDFRYTVHDPWHGEFHLDHCGALMDVEPMGEDYVRGMCHDIEDPTFDATALATNPHAQVRPIHRPPRSPANRSPHCAWTVRIDPSYPEPEPYPALAVNQRSRAATLELAPVDATDEGQSDYAGPLLSDVDFTAFSKSALVRIADEVCLQMHLLDRAFALAVADRVETADELERIRRKQLIGVAGIGGERLARSLGLDRIDDPVAAATRLLAVHPLLNPAAYVDASVGEGTVVVRPGPAHEDAAWISLCGPGWVDALQAVVRGLDPHLDVEVTGLGADEEWQLTVVRRAEAAPEAGEVAVVKFSTGATFEFQPRRSLPITPV
ncbi:MULTISPECIES: hypothetical protein [unclassified Nocardioides]|uniref:hypothetical protein n=1 Tax=unclassified Nocardioides TaxID=2615069 RepID=UPI0006FF666A|nr:MULTISPECIES: hypothetical protein [unclassified Nocardioides]KRA30939.1 hypothetical protein ASD81_15675 [Nocardioides sp. Root614]KRA87560.1 hypothetical protein ASD84_15950 [Nocardioides sp. Root682]